MIAKYLGEYVWVGPGTKPFIDYDRPVKVYHAYQRTRIETKWGHGHAKSGQRFIIFKDGTGATISDEGFSNRFMSVQQAQELNA